MKTVLFAFVVCSAILSSGASASDNAKDSIGFAVKQNIPATLTLHSSDGSPRGRLTPIRNNYRPKVDFGSGHEVICMFYLPPATKAISPGETSDVSLKCDEPVTIRKSDARFTVLEGGKKVGFGFVQVPSPQER